MKLNGALYPTSDDEMKYVLCQIYWFSIGVYQLYIRGVQNEAPRITAENDLELLPPYVAKISASVWPFNS